MTYILTTGDGHSLGEVRIDDHPAFPAAEQASGIGNIESTIPMHKASVTVALEQSAEDIRDRLKQALLGGLRRGEILIVGAGAIDGRRLGKSVPQQLAQELKEMTVPAFAEPQRPRDLTPTPDLSQGRLRSQWKREQFGRPRK